MRLLPYSIPMFQDISILKFSMLWRSTNQKDNQGTSTCATSLGPFSHTCVLYISLGLWYANLIIETWLHQQFARLVWEPWHAYTKGMCYKWQQPCPVFELYPGIHLTSKENYGQPRSDKPQNAGHSLLCRLGRLFTGCRNQPAEFHWHLTL